MTEKERRRDTMEEACCPVCLSEIQEGGHELECGHSFHSSCLIGWIRRGNLSCPTCRRYLGASEGEEGGEDDARPFFYFLTYDASQRVADMRRKARTSSASTALKRIVVRLRQAEREMKDAGRDLRDVSNEHSDVLKVISQKKRRKRAAARKVHRLKLQIANLDE